MIDYLSCGYPDISYHGESAWQPLAEAYQRRLGILYCGNFAPPKGYTTDQFIYVGMNLYWEPCMLALPRLPKGLKWQQFTTTAEDKKTDNTKLKNILEVDQDNSDKADQNEEEKMTFQTKIDERSISIFISVEDPEANRPKRKSKIKEQK